jgi:hypothetical protein
MRIYVTINGRRLFEREDGITLGDVVDPLSW